MEIDTAYAVPISATAIENYGEGMIITLALLKIEYMEIVHFSCIVYRSISVWEC